MVDGRVVSWTTRKTTDGGEGRRYITASPEQEALHHKHVLFGEDYCRDTIIVNEGPLSAMAIGPGATCTFGLNYTRQQFLRMVKYPRRVVAFDDQPEARKVADKLASELDQYPGETYVIRFGVKDAAELDDDEISEIRSRFLEDGETRS